MPKLIIVCLFLISCSSSKMIETQLHFGQTRPDGSMITDADWNNFKALHVYRIFKEGSTTISAKGSWLDTVTQKLISEPTYMISYFHKRSSKISMQIDSLRYYYKTMFQQQSILRVDKKVKVSF